MIPANEAAVFVLIQHLKLILSVERFKQTYKKQ